MIQRIYLLIKEIFSQKIISSIILITIFTSAFSIAIFEIVGSNFNDYIQKKFASSVPPNSIKITSLRKNAPFTYKTRNKIKKINYVKQIYSYYISKIPVQAMINLNIPFVANISYQSDIVCIGAPYSIIRKDLRGNKYKNLWGKWKPGKKIPFLVPKIMLEAYNQSMAEANNFPKISLKMQKLLLGTQIDLYMGRSSIYTHPAYSKENAVLSGVTDNVASLALIVPISVIKYFNKKIRKNIVNDHLYSYVKVSNHEAVLTVSRRLRKMKLRTKTTTSLSKEIILLKKKVNIVISILMYIILTISFIAIMVSIIIATLQRTEYYRIMRILGSSKTFITINILIKAFILGFIATFTAVYLIEYFINHNMSSISFFNYTIKLVFNEIIIKKIIIGGSLIAMLATIPAIFKLYFKNLNCD